MLHTAKQLDKWTFSHDGSCTRDRVQRMCSIQTHNNQQELQYCYYTSLHNSVVDIDEIHFVVSTIKSYVHISYSDNLRPVASSLKMIWPMGMASQLFIDSYNSVCIGVACMVLLLGLTWALDPVASRTSAAACHASPLKNAARACRILAAF